MDSKNSTAPANLVDGLKHAYLHFIDNYSARNFEELETLCSEKLMDKIRNEREEDLMLPFQRINIDLRINYKILEFDIIDFQIVYANLKEGDKMSDFVDITPMLILKMNFQLLLPSKNPFVLLKNFMNIKKPLMVRNLYIQFLVRFRTNQIITDSDKTSHWG